MRKFISILLCVCLAITSLSLFTGCSNRAQILKIYNVGEYMDEDVLAEFADWYKDQTGETVIVEYKTYITNEDMYTEIYKKHADYDVVCGSDYILSRMIKNGLAKPIDKEIIYGEQGGEDAVMDATIIDYVNDYENVNQDPLYDGSTRYSIPYMWGTVGIMYRRDIMEQMVSNGEAQSCLDWKNLSWDSLFKAGDYTGKRYMKNSVRDAYFTASVVANTEELKFASNNWTDYNTAEYQALINTVGNDTSAENMQKVENVLKEQKKYMFAYESDDGKDDMITSAPSGICGLFWSCDAGYAMEDSTDLYFGVPQEGSNLWVDGFMIPKFAQNEKAAQYFLKYLCTYDVGFANRSYAGCSSPITEVASDTKAIVEKALDCAKNGTDYGEENEDYEEVIYYYEMFTEAEGEDFGEMYIDMLFPPQDVLSRCAVMKDSDKDACIEMAVMWIRVKSSSVR